MSRQFRLSGSIFAFLMLTVFSLSSFSPSQAKRTPAKPAVSSKPAASKHSSSKADRSELAKAADPAIDSDAPRRDLPAPRLLNRRTLLSRHAMDFRGAHYRFGSAKPWVTDCSGLTMQLYRSVGIKLPRTSREQFRRGQPVAKEDLLPGDLVFFHTRGAGHVSHVGMYIGDGEMIHAANPHKGVVIESLCAPYYAHRFAGARRLLPEGSPIPETPDGATMGDGAPPTPDADADPTNSDSSGASAGSAQVSGDSDAEPPSRN